MDGGYIKLWRKVLDNQAWSRGMTHRALWVTLLLKTNWKRSYFNGNPVEAGQLAIGLDSVSRELKISKTTVHRVLCDLEGDGLIERQNMGNRYTLITIKNWATYQSTGEDDGTPAERRRNTDGTPPEHRQNTAGTPAEPSEEGKKNIYTTPSGLLSERTRSDASSPASSSFGNPPPKAPGTKASVPDFTVPSPSSPDEAEEKPQGKGPPACLYERIVGMYHATFPEHPRVALLNAKRKGAIKARWTDAGTRLRELKRPDSAAERLAYFQRLFSKASESDFLTGKKAFRDGHVYLVDFDKLMSPGGFMGVIEGKYDNREA